MSRASYAIGFVKAANAMGVDPVALAKFAEINENDVEKARADVADFNDRIVLPKKREFAGVPGRDYDASGYTRGMPLKVDLFKDKDAPKSFFERFLPPAFSGGATAGYVSTDDKEPILHLNRDILSPENLALTMVHEQQHDQARDVLRGGLWGELKDRMRGIKMHHAGRGRSAAEDAKLDAAYRFTPHDITKIFFGKPKDFPRSVVRAEQASTNREYQKQLDDEIAAKLGHKPSWEEYKRYLRGMSLDDIYDRYVKYNPNAYLQSSRDARAMAITSSSLRDRLRDIRSERRDEQKENPFAEFEQRDRDVRDLWKGISEPDLRMKKENPGAYQKSLEENKEWLEALRRAWIEARVRRNGTGAGAPTAYRSFA